MEDYNLFVLLAEKSLQPWSNKLEDCVWAGNSCGQWVPVGCSHHSNNSDHDQRCNNHCCCEWLFGWTVSPVCQHQCTPADTQSGCEYWFCFLICFCWRGSVTHTSLLLLLLSFHLFTLTVASALCHFMPLCPLCTARIHTQCVFVSDNLCSFKAVM